MNWMKSWICEQKEKREGSLPRFLTGLWAFLMLTAFPLYAQNRYSKMGEHKLRFFLTVSAVCLLPAAAGLFGRWLAERRRLHFSALDWAMLSYLGAAGLSWLFSVDRSRAWTGTDGWGMGLLAQALFVLIYFLVSRELPWKGGLLAGHFLGSGAVFLLGVLHRFGIDPLDMYAGLDTPHRLRFLSTIGQASWYSGYVCVVLIISVTLFYVSRSPALRAAAGAHCLLGFCTVVTQGSDSAFFAMGALFFGLFLVSCDGPDGMERLFETALLMLGGFKLMGALQIFFPERAVLVGGLSAFLSQSAFTWLVFLGVCLLYMWLLFYRQAHPEKERFACQRALRKAAASAAAVVLLSYLALVWLNTSGLLNAWFGKSSTNQYLLFDRYWGNSRGFIWTFTAGTYAAFSPLRKLFGVGPDCFSAYCYADAELAKTLDHYFGWDQVLTNAHNEFLNALFCLGIVGVLAFVAVLAIGFFRFFSARRAAPLALLGALGILVYSAHNFFCYQQVCCAPFLFLILGAAENAVRNARKMEADKQT